MSTTRATKRLYAWDVDRHGRFACIKEAPFDDDGEALALFNGMHLDPGACINLAKPKKGRLGDFLYSPTLMMYVSARALEVVQRGRVPNIEVHRVVLRDRQGRIADAEGYSWVNVKPLVSLLDAERSVFTRTLGGGIERVDKLVIREEGIPEDDLFLFEELSLPVFGERIVREIQAAELTGATFEELTTITWPT